MRERVQSIVSGLEENASPVGEDELEEAHAFLEWLHDDNFTFLGYREYDLFAQDGEDALRAVPESGLGILRETSPETTSHDFARLSPEGKKLARAYGVSPATIFRVLRTARQQGVAAATRRTQAIHRVAQQLSG